MTKFRPCIDLHDGHVKQIVGGSLREDGVGLKTNFESELSADYYAALYQKDGLTGGHVIKLGSGNEDAALSALLAYPSGLQLGGGICAENAEFWLRAGASHVIVTSWLFDEGGHFLSKRLDKLVREVGRERIVIDLSCRVLADGWVVAMNRWQTLTDLSITEKVLSELSGSCAEFLVHAADVEGQCGGIDARLVEFLGRHVSIPVTYAGGANSIEALGEVDNLSRGKVDLTIASALDLFGGQAVRYADCLAWNRRGTSVT
ncbi:MAG: phosphoribosylformimino-5-aminoimidazole carboxamide ribotide isomerase [Puniceicoccaceae bacterium]|nr:MAG: phosphoribosylformimino-5-aminoimidazole carboxamide ribotide isomerase [Puniceicoccaceae bacterium]